MRKYQIYAVVNGDSVRIRKQFKSRIAAIDYMIKYYERFYLSNFEIEEENIIEKHTIEYVENSYNRFIVERVAA